MWGGGDGEASILGGAQAPGGSAALSLSGLSLGCHLVLVTEDRKVSVWDALLPDWVFPKQSKRHWVFSEIPGLNTQRTFTELLGNNMDYSDIN